MQLSFNHPVNLLPYHGEAFFYPGFFSHLESDRFFAELMSHVSWKQEAIRIFGKEVMQPRLTAWYADKDVSYSYSGITMHGHDWFPTLLQIKQKLESFFRLSTNSALLNQYRNGSDSMGWHRDNEKELGAQPLIISVSFGAVRKFQLREYKDKKHQLSLNLGHGSVLIMKGESQKFWEHRIPKTTLVKEPRINITFRMVKS